MHTLGDRVLAPKPDEPLDDFANPSLYINRELSWLAFNSRVLAQATDPLHPLLERVRFLSIVATNLDEFYMIRVASLLRKLRNGLEDVSPDGLSTAQQLHRVHKAAAALMQEQADCWQTMLRPELEAAGIRFLDPADYSATVTEHLRLYFRREIWPVLTPLAFDPGHPFPYISNLSKNLAVAVSVGGRTRFARLKLPDALPRFVAVPSGHSASLLTFALLEDVVRANVHTLFSGTEVTGAYLFRIVRDADIVIQEDEADDLLESVDAGIRQRRHGALSLLQVESSMPRRILDTLVENFDVEEQNVIRTDYRLGFGDWSELLALHRPELKYTAFPPARVWDVDDGEQIFQEIRERDRLVHHPFQSFSAVEEFLRAAAGDPHVVAIKMMLYRIGPNSPLVDLLVEAAESGKQVAVLVELKARFDERNNIQWAHRLEEAGVHVVYGLVNLKTHGKLCLVVRKEHDGIRRYAHIGTGNYNPVTAKVYTDLGLFTSRPAVVEDVSELFNYLTGYSAQREYRELLVAPVSLRQGLRALIQREAEIAATGQPARIILKVNAITDPEIVRSLYRASQAGVEIDLLVRGVCSLRPGVAGVSERITVRSVVGRFLEHSRIFWFENAGQPKVFIGSADLMERNLDRRVEVLCPIHDQRIVEHITSVVLGAYLLDTCRTSQLLDTGQYVGVARPDAGRPINAHDLLLEWHARESEQD